MFGLHRCYFKMIDFKKLHGASETVWKVFFNIAVSQKSAKDGCKDAEIAVDTRFRH